ncbi:hypothetical protein ACM66Z_04280 [Sulfurovum sp. ST-21]|uniref:Uncharacterized protein n=1 Tax=Sulfurovum indicum TaxID=2779528 RepID=A0A7M1S7J1_9BACT|nr:hypothetical protein [Sulfurovum indicum]QOR62689.1 hypothetical protein IMZ28_04260 [Sulfurovum indicum]
MLRTLPHKKIVMNAIAAFFIYGTWAYGANDVGAVKSAMAQGSMSFANTLVLALYLEVVHRIASGLKQLIAYVFALFLSVVGIQVLIHYTVGTQNIFLTILPGMIIGTIYIVSYLYHLKRMEKVK